MGLLVLLRKVVGADRVDQDIRIVRIVSQGCMRMMGITGLVRVVMAA